VKYKSKTSCQVLLYERIKTELITKEFLKGIYQLVNAKENITIMEVPNFFYIQYASRPVILINRINGRLYANFSQGFTEGEIQHQASFVIRILKKFGLVKNVQYKNIKNFSCNKIEEKNIGRKKRKKEQVRKLLPFKVKCPSHSGEGEGEL